MGRHCSCISAWLDGRTSGLENCCQPLQGANGRSICRAGNRTNKHFIEEKGTEFRHHVRSTSLGRQEEEVGFLQCFFLLHIQSKGRSCTAFSPRTARIPERERYFPDRSFGREAISYGHVSWRQYYILK